MKTKLLTRIAGWTGIAAVAIPTLIQVLWQVAFRMGDNQAGRVKLFMGYFGGLFTETHQVTYLCLICSLAGIVLCAVTRNSAEGRLRQFLTPAMIVAILLLLLNVFSLL